MAILRRKANKEGVFGEEILIYENNGNYVFHSLGGNEKNVRKIESYLDVIYHPSQVVPEIIEGEVVYNGKCFLGIEKDGIIYIFEKLKENYFEMSKPKA